MRRLPSVFAERVKSPAWLRKRRASRRGHQADRGSPRPAYHLNCSPAQRYWDLPRRWKRSRGTLSLPRMLFTFVGILALLFFSTSSYGVPQGIPSGTVSSFTMRLKAFAKPARSVLGVTAAGGLSP